MITTGHATIGLTATLIDGTHNSDFKLTIHNADNTDVVYIGGPNVTVSNGLELDKHQMIQLAMNPLEEIYAVSSKEGHVINWLKQV